MCCSKENNCSDKERNLMINKNCMMNKKSVNAIIIVLLCIIMITVCVQKSTEDVNKDLFIGEWKCEDHPLQNEVYYFYHYTKFFCILYIKRVEERPCITPPHSNKILLSRYILSN